MKRFCCATLLSLLCIPPGIAEVTPAAEPEIIIREQQDRTIQEYRINGYLYAIKVTPKRGKPYYLVSADGGDFIRIDDPTSSQILVPRWKIFEW